MRRGIIIGVGLCLLALAVPALAELQNVEIGGEICIRGRWWHNAWSSPVSPEPRIPNFLLPARATGEALGVTGMYRWNSKGNDIRYVEQRTVLNVTADFTDDVRAFIELENYDRWGEDFRSNYITGADFVTTTADDVEIYQAYIEADNMFDLPLRMRIGRQELKMGKGWLAGHRICPCIGISFDAIRLTYTLDDLSIDAWWSKLAENFQAEEDGDVDYYGIYATYSGLDCVDLSAYWYYIRDARALNDTNFIWMVEWIEDALGMDNYGVTNFHTVGIRANGQTGALDYDLELAYQFGDADAVGVQFVPFLYGDDDANFNAFGADLEVGYTFDIAWQPRVFIGGAYFDGEDNRDLTFGEWLNPFNQPQASVSFNRMFSDKCYSTVMDILGGAQAMSNFWQIRGGVTAHPTDAITTGLNAGYLGVVDEFDWPRHFTVGDFRVPIAPNLSFWTSDSSDEIGVTVHAWVKYDYSEDWFIKVGWEHLFSGDGLRDGSYTLRNGLAFQGGSDGDDADYIYFHTGLKF